MMFAGGKIGLPFLALFVLTLANRESAAFFGVWLLCVAASNKFIHNRILWSQAALGLVLIAITVVYVVTIRDVLLVESTIGARNR